MRLLKLRIKNFRGIGSGDDRNGVEVTLDEQDIIFLIGKNNIGKSSILHAYDYFFQNPKSSIDDFHNKDVDLPIEIEVELLANKDEMEQLDLKLHGNGNPILRRIWEVPKEASTIYIGKYGCKPEVSKETSKEVKLLKADLPEPIWIRGMAKTQDVVSTIQNLVKDAILDQMKEDPIFKEAYKTVENSIISLQETLRESGFTDQLGNKMSQSLKKVFPEISLHIGNQGNEFDLPNLLHKCTQIQVLNEQNMGIDLGFQGHGVQRQVILSAYKECHEFFSLLRSKKTGKDYFSLNLDVAQSFSKTKILLIEEPELFLHPAGVRAVQRLLYDMAKDSPFQLMCATHSPIMIDLGRLHSSLVRLTKDKENNISLFQFRTDLDLEQDGIEKLRMVRSFNPHVCEAFFSDKVILVEGPTESVVINILLGQFREANLYDEDFITVIDCGGKSTIPHFQKILRHFKISYFVFHDLDSPDDEESNSGWETKNNNIWSEIIQAKHAGLNATRFVFNTNFEIAHPYLRQKNKGGKPYVASNQAKEWVCEWRHKGGIGPLIKRCPIVKFLWKIISDTWHDEVHDPQWILTQCPSKASINTTLGHQQEELKLFD